MKGEMKVSARKKMGQKERLREKLTTPEKKKLEKKKRNGDSISQRLLISPFRRPFLF